MENDFPKSMGSKLKAVGIYQIAGGVIGLGLTVWMASGLTTASFSLIGLLLIGASLYAYSIYCGTLLVRSKISGLRHSLINQFLQLISLSIFGFTFEYTSGVFVRVGIDLTNSFLFIFDLGVSQWQITINGNKETLVLNFNLVALFLILLLQKIKAEIEKDNIDKQISSIRN